jgi:hypothetical protein
MTLRKVEAFEPVTLGHIRGHGCRDLLVYCVSGRYHHGATINADWLSDETPVRSLCRRMVCTRWEMIGADVRPDWGPRLAGPFLLFARPQQTAASTHFRK